MFRRFVMNKAGDGTGGGSGGDGQNNDDANKGGDGAGAGGSDGQNNDTNKEPTVSKAEFDRVMSDLHKQKEKARKLEEEKKTHETNKMKEQNQWKEIAEQKEREAAELRGENDNIKKSIINREIHAAVKEKCMALGLTNVGDLDLLDLSSIQVETTSTGKINVLGADRFAQGLKTTKPHWFSAKAAPNVNNKNPRVVEDSNHNGAITTQQILDAQKEGKKTGNMQPYYDLHKKYQAQRLAARRG